MATDALTIAPTLHNITPERVAFVYNTNQSGSLEVAQYYRDKREIPNENLIGLSISTPAISADGLTCESVILDEADYAYQIETPLLAALSALGADFGTDGTSPIWVIILGYGIPLAFDDSGETIAIASRLHRLGQTAQNKRANHTFDRRGNFKFFDDDDASELFVTAVLDGPSVAAVKKLIDRSIDVDNQTFITGDVIVDPYGRKILTEDLAYQQDVLDFIANDISDLGLDSQTTVDIEDPYQEPTVSFFRHDSFYWGWFNPTFSRQLFLQQNERRVFLYNADDRSACNIHFLQSGSPFDLNGSDLWCNIAINIEPGYAACAGSVDEPGGDAFLRPTPFFRTLHQGATLGEAFLFASKFVSWKTVLIGDPLMVVNFPVDVPQDQNPSFQLLPNDEVILREKIIIEEALAWGSRQARLLTEVVTNVVASVDFDEELNLLHSTNNWSQQKQESAQTDIFSPVASQWSRYIQRTTNLSAAQWLEQNNLRITSRLNDVLQQTGAPSISSDSILPTGYWQFTFTFVHNILSLEDIHFELEIAINENFDSASIIHDLSSLTDTTGWSYEGQPFLFVQLPINGFPSNFSGRRVRFTSQTTHFLRITEVYYARWTAVDSNGTPFAGATATERIIISA
ncbi:MAG: TIGR03790 family protein [Promethearchaeota archaeon]|jgi:uncharacterized protein (TIGR03790 family)